VLPLGGVAQMYTCLRRRQGAIVVRRSTPDGVCVRLDRSLGRGDAPAFCRGVVGSLGGGLAARATPGVPYWYMACTVRH
jgi:hypothetical protein